MSYTQVADSPIGGTLLAMTAASVERCDLSDREIMIARISALVASGAPPISYALNTGAAVESGLTLEDAQGILVAVAPIVGSSRTAAGTEAIAEGLGLAIALMEAEMEAEIEAELDSEG